MRNILNGKTVVSLSSTDKHITLFFEDGDSETLKVDEKFTQEIVEIVTPVLATGGKVLLDTLKDSLSIYRKLEDSSNGLVKFFKAAKSFLSGSKEPSNYELIKEVLIPIASKDSISDKETIVAVVTDPKNPLETPKVVSGVEKIRVQVKHFSETTNPKGIIRFFERLSEVQSKRKHSADDLLRFLNRGDLPITNDGQILAYKRLYKQGYGNDFDKFGEHYVDSFTRKIIQKMNGKVFMSPDLVDPDRNNQCSYGLHIGRRDYMSSFSGNSIVLVLINPEDVIAVPRDYKNSKMRCAAYHIVGEVTPKAFKALDCLNKPATVCEETAKMITNILEGNIPEIVNYTEILKDNSIRTTFAEVKAEPEKKGVVVPAKALDTSEAAEEDADKVQIDPTINSPKAIKDKVKKADSSVKKALEMTYDQKLAKKLWGRVQDKTLTKAALAKKCNTSSRTLDRWAVKFNF